MTAISIHIMVIWYSNGTTLIILEDYDYGFDLIFILDIAMILNGYYQQL